MFFDKKEGKIYMDGSKEIELFSGDIVQGTEDYNEGALGVIVVSPQYETPVIIWKDAGFDEICEYMDEGIDNNSIQEIRRAKGYVSNFLNYDSLSIVYRKPSISPFTVMELQKTIKAQQEEIEDLKKQLLSKDNIMEKLSEILG